MRIRAWAEVAGHFTITDPRCVDALSPFYVWTTDYAEKRLAWKRRHPLHVLLLRTYRIPRPVTVKVKDEYAGCRSWLELQRELPFEGTPVLSDGEFERASEEIEAITREAGQPVGQQPVLASDQAHATGGPMRQPHRASPTALEHLRACSHSSPVGLADWDEHFTRPGREEVRHVETAAARRAMLGMPSRAESPGSALPRPDCCA